MEFLKQNLDSFGRNWGYFLFPIIVIALIVWVAGVLGLFMAEFSEMSASVFSSTPGYGR